MTLPSHKPLALALLLGAMSLLGLSVVSAVFYLSKEKIAHNQQNALRHSLQALLVGQLYDNDVLADSLQVRHPLLGNQQSHRLYRVRYQGKLVATVISCVAPTGYNGDILLLVAIKENGTLLGVQVVAHQETPGLGDGIEATRSDWITGFKQLNLQQRQPAQWAVKRDGGQFDQLVGATITSRAVVMAVKNAVLYAQHARHFGK